MTKKSKRSNMPSKMSIIKYWLHNHENHPEAKPWMDRVGEYFVERTCPDEIDICFACDFINGTTERAHIRALCNGGSNSPDNLHLLCSQCHKASEFIEGGAYWEWIADRRWWHLGAHNMVGRGTLTQTEAAMVLMYFGGDEETRQLMQPRIEKISDNVDSRISELKSIEIRNKKHREGRTV